MRSPNIIKSFIFLFALTFFWSCNMVYGNTPNKYLNKTILVTITISKDYKSIVKKQQFAAKIIRFDNNRIVLLPFNSKVEFGLPPDERYLLPAKQGIFQLENGNVKSMTNPDFETAINFAADNPYLDELLKHGFVTYN